MRLWRSIRAMTYRRMLYIFAIIKRNHFRMYMFGVVRETHAHDYFEVISFYNRPLQWSFSHQKVYCCNIPFQWSFSHQKVYWCNRPFQWYYTHFKHCDATKVRCCKLKQHVAASSTGVYFSQQIVFQLATTKFCCVTMSDVGGNTCNNTFQLRFFSWRKMLPVLPGLKSIVFYY